MKYLRLTLLGGLIAVLIVIFWLVPDGTFSLSAIQHYQRTFAAHVAQHPWQTAAVFFVAYVLVAALSIPGAALLTLLAGAQFGLLNGTLIISFASTLGATIAMLISRYLLRDIIQHRFTTPLEVINRGIHQDGARYLFAMRLAPVLPFFLINLLIGLTEFPLKRFWWVSQTGMLPATVIYLNAGRQLSELRSLDDIISPGMLLALLLLGLLPLLSRWCLPGVSHR